MNSESMYNVENSPIVKVCVVKVNVLRVNQNVTVKAVWNASVNNKTNVAVVGNEKLNNKKPLSTLF